MARHRRSRQQHENGEQQAQPVQATVLSARWTSLVVATLASGSVWALSPMLAGVREPWDAAGPFYPVALVIAGLVAGLFCPRPLWVLYVGAVAGQLAYELLFLPIGPLFPLGAVLLLGYSLIFLAGAALAANVRSRTGT